jgi:carbamoyl-phosphate synthase small subunit
MKFGHHGANHPVQDLDIGTRDDHQRRITVSRPTRRRCRPTLRATHRSLFDGSNRAFTRTDRPAFSFQGHPEASPGPHDASPLFDHFIELMQARR